MILGDFLKALGQLSDRRFFRVVLTGIALALLLFAALFWAMTILLGWLTPETLTLPWIGEIAWVHGALDWGSALVFAVLSVFLMAPVASAFSALFLDRVAEAVEDRYYPGLPPARAVTLGESLRDSLGFFVLLTLLSLLSLFFFLLSGPLTAGLFWALNGYLLGREYFQMAAMRRIGRRGAADLRGRHRWQIWLAGMLMAVPLSFPFVNLVIPVLGVATFTHLFHRLNRNSD